MKSIEELAKECGIAKYYFNEVLAPNAYLLGGTEEKLTKFAEAYHKQKLEELEPVGVLSIDYSGYGSYSRKKELPEGYHDLYTLPSKG